MMMTITVRGRRSAKRIKFILGGILFADFATADRIFFLTGTIFLGNTGAFNGAQEKNAPRTIAYRPDPRSRHRRDSIRKPS
jgi:hypothetical protein